MPKKEDGGPAFPRPVSEDRTHGDLFDGNDMVPAQAGMSLRDWFAGQALAGLLADGSVPLPYTETYQKDGFGPSATLAYAMADAMLHARQG